MNIFRQVISSVAKLLQQSIAVLCCEFYSCSCVGVHWVYQALLFVCEPVKTLFVKSVNAAVVDAAVFFHMRA